MINHNDDLSRRKRLILKAVVDAYIVSGEPVGSKYLTQNEQIAFSSATIRNEMAELEEMGYLEQPHTSAGRVPSEQGYRFYVNSLMHQYRLSAEELMELNALVKSRIAELDKLLDKAGKLMAMLTNYTSLLVKPKPQTVVIMRFKTMPLDGELFLLVMITSAETVKTKYIHAEREIDESVLARLERALNDLLTNVEMESMSLPLIVRLQDRMAGYEFLISTVMKCVYEAVSEVDDGDLKLEGVDRLLQYPEFSDFEILGRLLGLPERKEDILSVVSRARRDMVNIYIGSENAVDSMRHATLILKTITSEDRVIGAIGVIGPCRMDYSKVITTMEYLSGSLSEIINHRDGGTSENEKG